MSSWRAGSPVCAWWSGLGAEARAESELTGLKGLPVEIADYLADEVMAGQTPAILRFLLATSILDRFCAALCKYVLDDQRRQR